MFNELLQTAYDTGGDVMVQLRESCCSEQYRGRVVALDEGYFSLLHSGPRGGVRWAFRREDIAFCGLVLAVPNPFSDSEEDGGAPEEGSHQYEPREGDEKYESR